MIRPWNARRLPTGEHVVTGFVNERLVGLQVHVIADHAGAPSEDYVAELIAARLSSMEVGR